MLDCIFSPSIVSHLKKKTFVKSGFLVTCIGVVAIL